MSAAPSTLNYRQQMIKREKQRVIIQRLSLRYPPDSAVMIQALGTISEMDAVLALQENPPEHTINFIAFNECEVCGRDANDPACLHTRMEALTGVETNA